MKKSRRNFITGIVGAMGAVGIGVANSRPANACLVGSWWVRCPKCKKAERVDDITCQHVCKCGTQAFNGDSVTVSCSKGHDNVLTNTGTKDKKDQGKWVQSHKCTAEGCGLECRIK